MANKKSKRLKVSPEQIAALNHQWDDLVGQLAAEWPIRQQSSLQTGRILYEMKRWLRQWGMTKGCKGKWKSTLDRLGIAESTAYDDICRWQEHADIQPDNCVFVRKKSHKDSENNPPDSNGLAYSGPVAAVTPADEEDCDRSYEKRLGIECIFVLTMDEKRKFMDAVKVLGPFIATQEMYKAVIAKAAGTASMVGGVGA